MIRAVTSLPDPGVSKRSLESGNRGVRSSNFGRFLGFVRGQARDRVDPDQGRELLVARRRPARAFYVVALAEGEPARLADRDIYIAGTRQIAVGTEEAVALVA